MTGTVFEVQMKKAALAVCGGARYGEAGSGVIGRSDTNSDSGLFDSIGVIFLSTIRRLADKARLGERKKIIITSPFIHRGGFHDKQLTRR